MAKSFDIRRILVPTDFSETGMLAIEHAVLMAYLHKAELLLLHVIEITETSYSIYDPAVTIRDLGNIQDIVESRLRTISKKIKKDRGIKVNTLCTRGRVAHEVVTVVEDHNIDLIIMGTHGASGIGEFFIGSNAYKVVTLAPCPVITVQKHVKKLGFKKIILPIDNSLHSRQKVNYAVTLAKKYKAKIEILGLIDKSEGTDKNKFAIKLRSVERGIARAKLSFKTKVVTGNKLAVEAMNYCKKVKGDLIVIMSDHESNLTGIFMGALAKQIVNHSTIPVMSIKPVEGNFESIDLSGASSPY